MKAHLVKTHFVETAHRNPHGTPVQQRLHGHSYRIDVLASAEVDPVLGWIVDYADLKKLISPVIDRLDHACLNELPGLENDTRIPALEQWINDQIAQKPDWYEGVRVTIAGDLRFNPVRLPSCNREQLPERTQLTFEAAQSLPQLPQDHPCRNMHGHSYRIEIGSNDMDTLEPHLQDLYNLLDHTCLNDTEGLDHATCERICAWLWHWLEQRGVTPTIVVVQETPSASCRYFGE